MNNIDSDNVYDPPHPKIYYTCYVFDEAIDYYQKAKDGQNETFNYHTQKALVISSFYQFYVEFSGILQAIKKCIENNLIGFELEKVVHSLVFDIPTPTPGITKVSYGYSSLYTIEFELNPINKVPKSNAEIKMLFNFFKINQVIHILKYIILEIPVIFFCQDKHTLANVIKSFDEILFPFTYPFPVITILPKAYYKSLEKLDCFLAGINQEYTNDFFEINNINLNDKEYVVVSLSEQSDYFYKARNKEKYGILLKDLKKPIEKKTTPAKYMINEPNFPKHYHEKLIKNLNNLFIGKNSGIQGMLSTCENDDIRGQFYYFFISMLQHYKTYMCNDQTNLINIYSKVENESYNINELFKMTEFIFKDNDSIEFFQIFMVTKIWKTFLFKNFFPATIDEQLEVLLLDENIAKKKNRSMIKSLFKENTPFLETNIFDIKNVEVVKIACKQGEKMHLSLNQTELSKKFPLLNEDKMEHLYKKNFILSRTKIKNLYEAFYKECQNILNDKKFLEGYSSVNYDINLHEQLKTMKAYNEKYIPKLWFLLLCYNFRHINNEEKWTIFNELINEIESKTPSVKISIFDSFLSDVMFNTFIQYGDKEMCSLIYKELIDIPCVRDDYLIFANLHKKFMNKKGEFEISLPKEYYLKEKKYNLYNLPSECIMKIVLIDQCPVCKVDADLRQYIKNLETDKGEIYYNCTICHKDWKAKISVSYGKQYNDEHYQLYTPRYLYNRFKVLGYYNMNIFYELQKELFFNLLVLFDLNQYNYDFLYPYVDEKTYQGFDPESLEIKRIEGKSFVQKNKNENIPNWYDVVEESNPSKLKRFTKLLRSRKASCESFKTFEPLSSTAFFNKSINSLKGSSKNLSRFSNKSINRISNKSNRNSSKSNKDVNKDSNNNNNNNISLFALQHSKTISE